LLVLLLHGLNILVK